MSDDTSPTTIPTSKRERLVYSITNLVDDFGQTTNPLVGVAVNVGLALPGLVGAYALDGWMAGVALTWAIINLAGILKWVIEG